MELYPYHQHVDNRYRSRGAALVLLLLLLAWRLPAEALLFSSGQAPVGTPGSPSKGNACITIQTADGATFVQCMNRLKVSNGSLTDDGAGTVTLTTSGGGGGGTGDITAVGSCTTGACFTVGTPAASLVLNNATSGTVTLQTVAGALGTRTISFPAESGTVCTTASLCSGYEATLGFTPENVANKSSNTSLGTSDIAYPTQNAVKSYVDTAVAGVSGDVTAVGSCTSGACFTSGSPSASLVLNNATSGTITVQAVTGALGTRTLSLPAETGTLCTTGSVCSGYQASLGFTAENVANKSTNTSLGTSNTLYPSQNAVKSYVDTAVAGVSGDISAVGSCTTGACFTSGAPAASLVFNNATSGTVTLQTVTGALGTRTISLPAETGTVCTTGSVCSGYQASGSYLTANQTITLSGDVTGSGATSITATVVKATGNFAFAGTLSPTALSGNVNDYNPTSLSTALALRLDGGAADRNITGLTGGADGRIITITNIGSSNSLVLKNQDTNSTAANRFLLGADLTLGINAAMALRYDNTTQRWRPWSTPSASSLTNVTNDAQLKRSANDFNTFSQKTTPVDNDILLMEDSAASGAKKYFTLGKVNPVGLHTLLLPAAAWTPCVTNGASAAAVETTTNKNNYTVLDFAKTAGEVCASIKIAFPKSYNNGTLQFHPYFFATDTGNVVWGMQCAGLSYDDLIDVAYGTAQRVTYTVGGTGRNTSGAVSSGVTAAGTVTGDTLLDCRLFRDGGNGSDTNSGTARMAVVKWYYSTSAPNDN